MNEKTRMAKSKIRVKLALISEIPTVQCFHDKKFQAGFTRIISNPF